MSRERAGEVAPTQSSRLVRTLKGLLRQRGVTYLQLAEVLGLSEASVKRLLSRDVAALTLDRLERICAVLGLDLVELVQRMDDEHEHVHRLSEKQEQELVSDVELLLVAVCVLNHWRYEDIVSTYRLSPARCTSLLLRLDRLRLVEVRAENRIRLKVARDFAWRPDGPIERFFRAHIQQAFLEDGFEQPGASLTFATGMLSPAANAALQRRIRQLAAEFSELHRADRSLSIGERAGTCLLVAMRPWEPPAFAALRRPPRS